jgi:hypothetical protein
MPSTAEVQLPSGAVEGLPDKLTIMDSDGTPANSETGEYYFCVYDMVPNETYTKNIQVINLREDKAYHIYFSAEPLDKSGTIDLEEECEAVITLGSTEIYRGKVTGEGNIDLTSTPLDLGLFTPGDSRILNCKVTWQSDGTDVDNGQRLVDADGTHIIREGNQSESYGEVTFKWVFYAVVDESYVPPKTGLLGTSNLGYIIALVVCVMMVIIMLILIQRKKRLQNQGKGS